MSTWFGGSTGSETDTLQLQLTTRAAWTSSQLYLFLLTRKSCTMKNTATK